PLLSTLFPSRRSSDLFQTVTDNRILTPSIMGFDALYLLLQTFLVFTIGSARLAAVDGGVRFGGEVAVMVTFGVMLYRWLLIGARDRKSTRLNSSHVKI